MHIVFTKPEWESREVVYYKPLYELEPDMGYNIIVKIGDIFWASRGYRPDCDWGEMRIGRGGDVLPWAKIVTSFDPYDEAATEKAFWNFFGRRKNHTMDAIWWPEDP